MTRRNERTQPDLVRAVVRTTGKSVEEATALVGSIRAVAKKRTYRHCLAFETKDLLAEREPGWVLATWERTRWCSPDRLTTMRWVVLDQAAWDRRLASRIEVAARLRRVLAAATK